jgi:uncharacterized protein
MMFQPPTLSQKILILIAIMVISTAFGLILILLLLKLGANSPLQIDNLDKIFNQENVHLLKPTLAINHLTTFVATALIFNYYILANISTRYILFQIKLDWQMLFKSILFILCCYPLAGILTVLIAQLDLPKAMNNLSNENINIISKLINSANGFELFTSILVVALIPSIGEELLFRGLIQKILSEHLPIYVAIGLTGFLFAALHFDPVGIGFKFLLGGAFGIIYYYSKNILIPIIIHFLNNALPIIYSHFIDLSEIKGPENNIPEVLISALIFIPLAYFTFKNVQKHYNYG